MNRNDKTVAINVSVGAASTFGKTFLKNRRQGR